MEKPPPQVSQTPKPCRTKLHPPHQRTPKRLRIWRGEPSHLHARRPVARAALLRSHALLVPQVHQPRTHARGQLRHRRRRAQLLRHGAPHVHLNKIRTSKTSEAESCGEAAHCAHSLVRRLGVPHRVEGGARSKGLLTCLGTASPASSAAECPTAQLTCVTSGCGRVLRLGGGTGDLGGDACVSPAPGNPPSAPSDRPVPPSAPIAAAVASSRSASASRSAAW
jgi:hypothetical protein